MGGDVRRAARAACCGGRQRRDALERHAHRRQRGGASGRAGRRCAPRRGSPRPGRASPTARRRRPRPARGCRAAACARRAGSGLDRGLRRAPGRTRAALARSTTSGCPTRSGAAAGSRAGGAIQSLTPAASSGCGCSRAPASFSAERVAVDQRQHAQRGRRVAQRQPPRRGACQLAPLQRERRVERRAGPPRGSRCAPTASAPGAVARASVALVHAHERRDVQRLVEARPEHRARRPPRARSAWRSPHGRVGDLGDDRLDAARPSVEAVVEAHRVEAVPERAQVGEQADRAGGRDAGALARRASRTASASGARVAEVVARGGSARARAARARGGRRAAPAARRGRRTPARGGGVNCLARLGEAAVADRALVEAARGHSHSASPKRAGHPRSALTTPSSWKPQPQ